MSDYCNDTIQCRLNLRRYKILVGILDKNLQKYLKYIKSRSKYNEHISLIYNCKLMTQQNKHIYYKGNGIAV